MDVHQAHGATSPKLWTSLVATTARREPTRLLWVSRLLTSVTLALPESILMKKVIHGRASACFVVWITTLRTRQRLRAKNVTLGSTRTKKEPRRASSVMLVKS